MPASSFISALPRPSAAKIRERVERDLYDREFLVSRPLLQALEHRGPMPPVLLIDEVDRSDDEFEAFLSGDPL